MNRHIVEQLTKLLSDEHALRHLSGLDDAADLKALFSAVRYVAARLDRPRDTYDVVRSVVANIKVHKGHLELKLSPEAFEFDGLPSWIWTVPLPARKPYREAKLRIDANIQGDGPSTQLIELLSDASKAQKLVMASPDLSLNHIALREGRCRKQLTKLFRLSFLSPRIVDTIVAGEQPSTLTRQRLLKSDLPIDWSEQHQLFGITA